MNTALLFQVQSFLILSLIFFGVYNRRKRKAHIKIMSTAIAWDVILILQIELSRGAIIKASKAATNEIMLNIHVAIAVSTVLLYFAMIYTGRKILSGNYTFRKKHRILGYSALGMRILTFITSFWAVSLA